MGLSKPALRFLVREHRRQPLQGAWLTLGRQCVYATFDEFTQICREEGVGPRELPHDGSRLSNIPSWQGTPLGHNTSDQAVLWSLGADEVLALDYSGFEGAELICDFNQPVPAELRGRFQGVLDSGTLEHVFDVRAALTNVVQMLRVGGRVIHISPLNNFANHGFYQFSPTLLADFYHANAFAELQVYVAEEVGMNRPSGFWNLYQIDPRRQPLMMMSRRRLLLIVVAEKTAASTADRVPLQGFYAQMFGSPDAGRQESAPLPASGTLRGVLKQILPVPFKTWVRRYLLPGPQRRPWGTKYLGRLR